MNVKSLTKSVSFSLTELYKLSTGSDEEQEKIAKDIQNRITEVPEKRFENLSDLLTWCNITPKEFADRTGYNYRAVLSWLKGVEIPKDIRKNILAITVTRSPRIKGYWETIRLQGAKIRFVFKGEVLLLDENKFLIGDKPKNLTCDIWNQSPMIENDCFLKK